MPQLQIMKEQMTEQIQPKTQTQILFLVKTNFRRQSWPANGHRYDLNQKSLTYSTFKRLLKEIVQYEEKLNEPKARLTLVLGNWGRENRNTLGVMGCKLLSKFGLNWLAKLTLDENGIGDEGCRYISQALWPHLQILSLRGNKITKKGCVYLARINLCWIENIDLRENPITREGLDLLEAAHSVDTAIVCDEEYYPPQVLH